ncbi:hypothetical protein NMY22_g17544 [Coprinellus aureogranulatus]|nr:hypothetical protein NMY22_g17544 [Coprinellus aureogranulatus]
MTIIPTQSMNTVPQRNVSHKVPRTASWDQATGRQLRARCHSRQFESTNVSTGVSTSAAVPPAVASSAIPPPSAIIPGFDSLGPQHPPPKPEDAVFCTDTDGPPFYTVTRGKRVGCFGGWDMVSPYVVKAQGVVYGKKPSLAVAYDAYVKAYERGAVQYI